MWCKVKFELPHIALLIAAFDYIAVSEFESLLATRKTGLMQLGQPQRMRARIPVKWIYKIYKNERKMLRYMLDIKQSRSNRHNIALIILLSMRLSARRSAGGSLTSPDTVFAYRHTSPPTALSSEKPRSVHLFSLAS